MPQKAKPDSDSQRSKRFKKDAQQLIDEGRLDPVDAEELLDLTVNRLPPD
jgi:mRNA-degrading endonuclease YafQ of YafQ-DinJ toxin-antitoxin module